MELSELLQFIATEDGRLAKMYGYPDREKRILARTVKVGEEFGELCDEVLAHSSLQRADKLDAHDQGNLPEEFADVLFTTFLLAKAMDVDVEKAILKKMDKVNKRYS